MEGAPPPFHPSPLQGGGREGGPAPDMRTCPAARRPPFPLSNPPRRLPLRRRPPTRSSPWTGRRSRYGRRAAAVSPLPPSGGRSGGGSRTRRADTPGGSRAAVSAIELPAPIATLWRQWHNAVMAVQITIRGVPEEVRDRLALRAARHNAGRCRDSCAASWNVSPCARPSRSGCNLTCYDAWCVALAEALGCPLVTLDGRLARAAGPECRIVVPPWLDLGRTHDPMQR